MLYTIKNHQLEVKISTHGAEVKSVLFKGEERIHDSNPEYWNRSAPLLFPCVGTILNKSTIINNKSYPLTKHGFIRDVEFKLVSLTDNEIELEFESNEQTLVLYPFNFKFQVIYRIINDTMESVINITNLTNEVMPFNLGLHPAFKTPIRADEKFEDYELVFNSSEQAPIYKVDLPVGTINLNEIVKTIDFSHPLPLNHEDYRNDALVFNNTHLNQVTLQNKQRTHGVVFNFYNFPMLGIWTPYPKEAPFICIEPWIGCADLTNHDGEFEHKIHLIKLMPNELKSFNYNWRFF